MKPLYLKITSGQIIYSDIEKAPDGQIYTLNSELELKKNLQEFKKIFSDPYDSIVITTPSESLLKKNVFAFNEDKLDFASELEDIFHIPVVNIVDVHSTNLHTAIEKEAKHSSWHLDYYGIDHGKRQYGQESMQSIGNGFLGLRGTYLEAKYNDDNYPATYVAGVFNQLATPINGRNVINEDLVNLPNAQYITFRINDGDFFKIDEKLITESLRSLDMKHGVLTITLLVKLPDGKELKIIEKKVADMTNYHDYYLQYSIEPLNFSGKITILTQIDASVVNDNVERYRNLAKKHLSIDKIDSDDKFITLLAHTTQSKINLAVRTNLSYPEINNPRYTEEYTEETASQCVAFAVQANNTLIRSKNLSASSLHWKHNKMLNRLPRHISSYLAFKPLLIQHVRLGKKFGRRKTSL